MATRRESQRVYAEGLHEPRNRKERREADAAFARRVKARERRRKVKAIKEGIVGTIVGAVAAAAFTWMLFLAPDPYAEAMAEKEPTFTAWNGQEYTYSEYESMMQERQMYLEEYGN